MPVPDDNIGVVVLAIGDHCAALPGETRRAKPSPRGTAPR